MRDLTALYDAGRLRTYSRILLLGYAAAIAGLIVMSRGFVDASGKPLGYDFITFWSAGRLSLEGNAVAAFDFRALFDMQRVAVPSTVTFFAWHYPPTFQLMAAALAVPPYFLSLVLFVAASLAFFVWALRPLVPSRDAAIVLLALPGTFVCALHGQNSLLTAGLLALALINLDRRPILAGVFIGLLAYKPQMGALFPLVLALTGRWRAFAAAAATVAVFVAASIMAFGTGLWLAFLHNLPVVREVVETGQLPWGKMPSAFVFLRMIGVSQTIAYAAQSVVAVAAVVITALVWRRTGGTLLAGATLVAGTLLLTPYTFDYELALLAIPLAILARHHARHGASLWQSAALLLLAACPLAMGAAIDHIGVQLGFLAIAAVFLWSPRLAWISTPAPRALIPAVAPRHILSDAA